MKSRVLVIFIVVIVISISTLLVINYTQFENKMEDSIQNSSWVKNCVPAGPDEYVASIGIKNKTHNFDLQNCVWQTNDEFIVGDIQKSESDVTDSLKIPNAERDAKLAAGYKLYPGVGWVHPDDQGSQKPIYRDNPNNPGELVLDLDAMIKKYNLDQEINIPIYPRFDNGVTEIINSEFMPLKYKVTRPVIDETYLSKNVQQWKDAWEYELEVEYEKYGDDFYTELGRLLIKNEMQYQMDDLGIINANDDFEVFSGGMLLSLPPHIGYSAVIYATDGNYYRLEGGTFANKVSYYKTTQLQFPDITEKLSMESILSKSQLITIIPENGNKARQEPTTLVIHVDNNAVEFFNNTPEVIRIQDSGSGRVGEENTLDWMGPIILPFQKATITFDKPGLIEWDARNAPNLEDPLWWSTHAGGYIVVLSDYMDNFSREDKARIAQEMLHNSDIPITSSGAGNAEKVLKLGLDPAVMNMVPNAEEYYLQRAHQLIPFDVEIVMYE